MLMDSSDSEPEASVRFYQTQLIKDMGQSTLAKQVMIDQLIVLKKSLLGSSAAKLNSVFKKLQLNSVSLKKMNSGEWPERAQGIFELAQMYVLNATATTKIYTLSLHDALPI